jgi:hypothetical protein
MMGEAGTGKIVSEAIHHVGFAPADEVPGAESRELTLVEARGVSCAPDILGRDSFQSEGTP